MDRRVLAVARGVFASLDLDSSQTRILGATNVSLDIIADHDHLIRTEPEIIERQGEERKAATMKARFG